MLTAKQMKEYLERGFSEKTLLEISAFLESGSFELYNLVGLGDGDYRLMYREQTGINAKGEPVTKMQCKLSVITF